MTASSFDPEYAKSLQESLARQVVREDDFARIATIAGVDVAYSQRTDQVVGAAVLLDASTLDVLETQTAALHSDVPYIPGLFSFRELPAVERALDALTQQPNLIICDGQGIAHPRRCGLASHLGLTRNVPTIGCAKTRLVGEHKPLGPVRGDYESLIDQGEELGVILRTQTNVNPLYVSIGHRISIQSAIEWVLHCCSKYRLPQTTRFADQAVRRAMGFVS